MELEARSVTSVTMLIVALLILLTTIETSLIIRPKNVTVSMGMPVLLSCATDLQERILWSYRKPGNDYNNDIYVEGKLWDSKYTIMNRVNRSGIYLRHFDLQIADVQMSDAATYLCSDNEGSGDIAYAYVTVIRNEGVNTEAQTLESSLLDSSVENNTEIHGMPLNRSIYLGFLVALSSIFLITVALLICLIQKHKRIRYLTSQISNKSDVRCVDHSVKSRNYEPSSRTNTVPGHLYEDMTFLQYEKLSPGVILVPGSKSQYTLLDDTTPSNDVISQTILPNYVEILP